MIIASHTFSVIVKPTDRFTALVLHHLHFSGFARTSSAWPSTRRVCTSPPGSRTRSGSSTFSSTTWGSSTSSRCGSAGKDTCSGGCKSEYLIMFLQRMSLFSHGGHLLVAAIKVSRYQVWLSAPRATCAGHHPRVQHHHLRDPARAEGAPGPGHLRLMVPGRPQARLLCWQRLPLRVECRNRWEYDKYTQCTDQKQCYRRIAQWAHK